MEKNTTHVDQLRNKPFDNGASNNRSSDSRSSEGNPDMGAGFSSGSASGSNPGSNSGTIIGSNPGLSAGLNTGSTSGAGSNLSSGASSAMGYAENSMDQMKDSAMNTFNDAKRSWSNIEHALLAKGQEAGKASRIYIYQNPFRSVLVASAAGLILGFLLSVMRK